MAESPVVLLGSAGTPWPEPGCGCRSCLAASRPAAAASLRAGQVVLRGSTVIPGTGRSPLAIRAGTALELGGIRIVGLPGPAGAAAVVLASPDIGTVLWAPDPGTLPETSLEALSGADLEVVALGSGPDGALLARSLARLRRVGALASRCDVVAVGLDHTTSLDRLARLLPVWGARLASDGAPLGPDRVVTPDRPRRTLVLGPASSGKSAVAEALLAAEPEVDYLPTGASPSPDDQDWSARVASHQARRPAWWRTLEGASPSATLVAGGPPLLLDSVGTWIAGVLSWCGAWDDAPGWRQALEAEVDAVVGAWRQGRRRVVGVAEEVGWGVIPATAAGRRFREAMGTVNQRLAAESERVLLVVAGQVVEIPELGPGVPSV